MKKKTITLISVDEYGPSIGLRFLLASLKKAGYETSALFSPGKVRKENVENEKKFYNDQIHEELLNIVSKSLFVGISVVTSTYHKAVEITKNIKMHTNIPVIWGGIHAIVEPQDCLKWADMVCVGEGEELILDLAFRLENNISIEDIPGLYFKGFNAKFTASNIIDLKSLPIPEYDLEGNHYIINQDKISKLDKARINEYLDHEYYLAPSRGCPYKCSYCINSKYNELYQKSKRFRFRDIDTLIEELIIVKNNFPEIYTIIIDDDCFMALKEETIVEFCQKYKKLINIPFVLRGAHPQNITENKIKNLCDAGMKKLRLGIQTGSDRIRAQYDRKWESNEKLLSVAKLINKFINNGQLELVMYDLIVDNPWENNEDIMQSFKLMISFPRPFGLYIFAFTLYPGTKLFDIAVEEGSSRLDILNKVYWQGFEAIKGTRINKVYEIMQSMPNLSNNFLKLLVMKNPISKIVLNFLLFLCRGFPEIALFGNTLLRFRIDIKVANDKTENYSFFNEYFNTLKKNKVPAIIIRIKRRLIKKYLLNVKKKNNLISAK